MNCDLKITFPEAVKGQGIYLYGEDGGRYLDGCAGALVANLGYGVPEITQAMADQAARLTYVYRYHFSSPWAEKLAGRYCELTAEPMGRVYFNNSGSEASETAVKLARTRHLSVGQGGRHKIISRWQSYHGITMGALAWSGFTARRADYQPYLKDFVHLPPAFCYRCWFKARPETCELECARALESAILTEGPETVSAFMAEPVSGSSLAAAVPPAEYFGLIREICDRYGVLFLAEEVMTGAGRTGGRFFASDHFQGNPDIIVFGKGVGGGFYPLAGAMVSQRVAREIAEGVGGFGAGQSYSGHPVGMAAGLAVLDYLEKHDLLEKAREMGEYLGQGLEELRGYPLVGDVRGMGLMRGLELVRNKVTKEPFDPKLHVYERFYGECRKRGLLVLPASGCDRGQRGDMALLGPPLTITREEIDELVGILGEALKGLAA
jgi:adenosylmethionine-8-amino-7-oxononanoate aminotransferase